MNQKEVNEIKAQLWEHLSAIQKRIDDLKEEGIYPDQREFYDTWKWGRRYSWWVIDQYTFCRDEIEYWKEVTV